ncbi:TraB/GumN family protein [Candidatus Woesearchaeota archaeon]|nr:TraB/GumN family protein [Candidatus Woesearchaeota archaeon]USN44817.1 MAG: TraB/GumN family protein [Candidatus Woesearchaeota archaeon]
MISKIGNIILIGTSHVSKQSVQEIQQTIEANKPSVVGIELDIGRLRQLLSDKEQKSNAKTNRYMRQELGTTGYLFAKLASYVQKKVGNSLGIEPGVDMKAAYLTARDAKIPVALIDIDIRKTLKKFSNLSFTKKVGFATKLLTTGFKKKYRQELSFDPKQGVPSAEKIAKMLKVVQKEVPELYKILIEDRNKYMSEKLQELSQKHPNETIIAVVGAGHLEGMEKIIKELQKNEPQNHTYSFSFSTTQD